MRNPLACLTALIASFLARMAVSVWHYCQNCILWPLTVSVIFVIASELDGVENEGIAALARRAWLA